MNCGRWLGLIASVALPCICAFPVYAQDNSREVCGVPLNSPGTLSWQNYLDQADEPGRKIDHDTLADMTRERAIDWPQSISGRVFSALESFEAGELPATAIRIVPNTDLPPKQIGFTGTAHALEFPSDADAEPCRDPAESAARVEAAYVILLMERAHAAVVVPGMAFTARQIAALEKEYDRYLFEGFPMFPWEAWANSLFLAQDTIAQGPPRNAIVLLHPAAGVVGSVESGTSSDSGAVLSIEPLGWIRYSGDYDEWYGASLLAVFPADRNAGYGIAFNYKNYKLGVTWHDDDAEHDGAAIFLGMDLLQFIDSRHREYKSYREKLDETLRSGSLER